MRSRGVVVLATLCVAWSFPLIAGKPAPPPNPVIAARSWSPAGAAVMNVDGSNKTMVSPLCWSPSWSPSGSATVDSPWEMVCAQSQNGQRWLERIAVWVDQGSIASSKVPIAGPTAPSSPAWSPLGEEIAYANESVLEVIPPAGGTPTPLYYGAGTLHGVAWSHDGSVIYFYEYIEGIYSIKALNRTSGAVSTITQPGDYSNLGNMSYANTAEKLVFCATPAGDSRHYIYTLDVSTPGALPAVLTEGGHHPRFSPDDTQLAMSLSGGMFFKLQIYNVATKRTKTIDPDAVSPDWHR